MSNAQDERDTLAKQRGESERAIAAAKREFDNDRNRKDPKHTQDRMDAAVHDLRVRMGLERD